ncbi:MAG: YceI family protein [Chitinophagales bacterium]
MKKILFLSLVTFLFANGLFAQQSFEVDLENSSVQWFAQKVGGKHDGLVDIKQASITLNDEGEVSSANIVIDMQSISVEDLSGGAKDALTKHLKDADFFNTEEHPMASFVVNKASDKSGVASGILTIKNVSKEYTLNYTRSDNQLQGTLMVDRTDFDIMYKSKSVLDAKAVADGFIYDEFKITFTLEQK